VSGPAHDVRKPAAYPNACPTVIALIAAQTGGGPLPRVALAPIVAVSSGRWESVR
jgi:hypothetical protein